MVLNDGLRAALRELITNPSNPVISAEHGNHLIELGLATRWANLVAITRAGRLAAFADGGKSAT
jgi:hypothetical protein